MPDDWDDHAGWENYYRNLPAFEYEFRAATTNIGSIGTSELGKFIQQSREEERLSIWLPGCGLSPLPRLLSTFGFTVYATDVAASAIAFQRANEVSIEPLIARIDPDVSRSDSGRFIAEVHDFRSSFGSDKVDWIINGKAIQALSLSSLNLACQTHVDALRPGGLAIFDTMNLQGVGRDRLEDALADAGFYIPLRELDRWYRDALRATGIPHMMVLGRPIIPEREDIPYPHRRGSPERERDMAILREIAQQYRSRIPAAIAEEQRSVNEQTKQAQVIYSTG